MERICENCARFTKTGIEDNEGVCPKYGFNTDELSWPEFPFEDESRCKDCFKERVTQAEPGVHEKWDVSIDEIKAFFEGEGFVVDNIILKETRLYKPLSVWETMLTTKQHGGLSVKLCAYKIEKNISFKKIETFFTEKGFYSTIKASTTIVRKSHIISFFLPEIINTNWLDFQSHEENQTYSILSISVEASEDTITCQ